MTLREINEGGCENGANLLEVFNASTVQLTPDYSDSTGTFESRKIGRKNFLPTGIIKICLWLKIHQTRQTAIKWDGINQGGQKHGWKLQMKGENVGEIS